MPARGLNGGGEAESRRGAIQPFGHNTELALPEWTASFNPGDNVPENFRAA